MAISLKLKNNKKQQGDSKKSLYDDLKPFLTFALSDFYQKIFLNHFKNLNPVMASRERCGLSQRQASRQSGISQDRLRLIEHGRFDLATPAEIARLAELYADSMLPLLFCASCSALLRGAAPASARIVELLQAEAERHLGRIAWLAEHRDGFTSQNFEQNIMDAAEALRCSVLSYSLMLIQSSPPSSK